MTIQLSFNFEYTALYVAHFEFLSFCDRYAGMTSDLSIVRSFRSMHTQLLDLKNYAYCSDLISSDFYFVITTSISDAHDQFWGHI